jgi:4'-phosphopantetheinyl transferase
MIEIFIQDIETISTSKYDSFFFSLPITMQKEVSRYRQKEDRQRTLTGKILLLNYLKKYTDFNLFDIKKNQYNKPYIPNSNISFNISHAGKYVVLASTFANVLGIDIEEMNPNININEFKEVLSREEYDRLRKSTKHIYDFYLIWTRKEALLKAKGKGFFDDIKEIKIKDDTIFFKNKEYCMQSYKFENYLISLVYKNRDETNILIIS